MIFTTAFSRSPSPVYTPEGKHPLLKKKKHNMGNVLFPRVAENCFLTAELWANLFPSVNLSVLICKMGGVTLTA